MGWMGEMSVPMTSTSGNSSPKSLRGEAHAHVSGGFHGIPFRYYVTGFTYMAQIPGIAVSLKEKDRRQINSHTCTGSYVENSLRASVSQSTSCLHPTDRIWKKKKTPTLILSFSRGARYSLPPMASVWAW